MHTEIGGFICHDEGLIHGTGVTKAEAHADALQTLKDAQINVIADDADTDKELGSWMYAHELKVTPATDALLAMVADKGGACGWHICGRVACTWDEAEAWTPASARRRVGGTFGT